MTIISTDHYLWKVIPDLEKVCEPLFRETEITYFNYARIYSDKTVGGLFTHPQWLLHSIQNHVVPSLKEMQNFPRYTLFGSNIDTPSFEIQKHTKGAKEFQDLLGFDYLFCIHIPSADYIETFAFATFMGNQKIIEFYINNLNYLEKFIVYFYEKAASLIKNATLPENRIKFEKEDPSISLKKLKSEKHSNLKLIIPAKFGKPLTKREMQCLAHLSKGRTIKEIGNILALSNRTVESHIHNMKTKLGCRRKSDLINIALNYRMDVFYKKIF